MGIQDELPFTTIHRSLVRPLLVMECEREPMMYVALISLLIFVSGQLRLWYIVSSLVFFLVSLAFLRAIAKADPFMYRVFVRHIRLKRYYPAIPQIWSGEKKIISIAPWSGQ